MGCERAVTGRIEDARSGRARETRTASAFDVAHVVRGQYAGYRDELGVAAGSATETMAAVRAEIDNWRWAGFRSSCAPASAWPPADR
jgi:glucose-6-phosphate 1-dehydrogenase